MKLTTWMNKIDLSVQWSERNKIQRPSESEVFYLFVEKLVKRQIWDKYNIEKILCVSSFSNKTSQLLLDVYVPVVVNEWMRKWVNEWMQEGRDGKIHARPTSPAKYFRFRAVCAVYSPFIHPLSQHVVCDRCIMNTLPAPPPSSSRGLPITEIPCKKVHVLLTGSSCFIERPQGGKGREEKNPARKEKRGHPLNSIKRHWGRGAKWSKFAAHLSAIKSLIRTAHPIPRYNRSLPSGAFDKATRAYIVAVIFRT